MLAAPLVNDEPMIEAWEAWNLFARVVTCCFPASALTCFNVMGKGPQQAWREKVTLCAIFFLLSAFVVFFIAGLNPLMCPATTKIDFIPPNTSGSILVQGITYNLAASSVNLQNSIKNAQGQDASDLFALPTYPACVGLDTDVYPFARASVAPACVASKTCLSTDGLVPYKTTSTGQAVDPTAAYTWDELQARHYIVFKEAVLNFAPYYRSAPIPGNPVDDLLRYFQSAGISDASRSLVLHEAFANNPAARECLNQRFLAGRINEESISCVFALVISIVVAIIVLSVMITRFAMAVFFDWFVSHRLARTPLNIAPTVISSSLSRPSRRIGDESAGKAGFDTELGALNGDGLKKQPSMDSVSIGLDLYTILLVTCYSEGEASLRTTMESLAATDYTDSRKLLFVIADGNITGKGNAKSTPDLLLDMIEVDETFGGEPKPYSYIAVASGSKGHNMARVYVGHFVQGDHRVPTILVIKCGTPEEASDAKPGNRGKRDSQLILMNFFTRVMLNDRMTPLDFDLFRKTQHLMGVTPDYFEIVLMVDADTQVAKDSLRLMINAMHNDPAIMGLCGETRIENKTQNWVTMIQVFEYYISHHLGKAFESMFGGVTCLPGCFCMYRIKARRDNGDWVPILVNPDVVETYSTNEVESLHQKNLLLLGEDRFLTTMMLRTFPHRKMVFIPRAVCKTIVPDDFATLLSQRRRWINSTIHNLAELILVNNLCGTFCFSMQFIVFLDLISTAVLPASIVAALYIIIEVAIKASSTAFTTGQLYTIGTLCLVIFFPCMIVLLSFRRYQFIGWLLVYICALPIWNLVLPLYAFWHFDDFSWGATRQLAGQKSQARGGDHGDASGVFDGSKVSLKRWEEYERAWRRRKFQAKAAARNAKLRQEYERDQYSSAASSSSQLTHIEHSHEGMGGHRTQSLSSFDFGNASSSSVNSQHGGDDEGAAIGSFPRKVSVRRHPVNDFHVPQRSTSQDSFHSQAPLDPIGRNSEHHFGEATHHVPHLMQRMGSVDSVASSAPSYSSAGAPQRHLYPDHRYQAM
ncbi:hypothetical protein HKX48_004565 [Thoreauomyces humboldtii]|nr:hypothetical protein HKX48_004565 [Thoreauomyces humboldtii]